MKRTYCNICGSRFGFWDEQESYGIHTRCGYGSENDGSVLDLDICCSCMDALVRKCAINPVAVDIDDGSVEEMFNENENS